MQGLCLHRGANRISFADLMAMPDPAILGPKHDPMRHDDLVDHIKRGLHRLGYKTGREEFGIKAAGDRLFGFMEVIPDSGGQEIVTDNERSLAIAFRHANDLSLKFKIYAGNHVFICDNMVIKGDFLVLNRFHRTDEKKPFVEALDESLELWQTKCLKLEEKVQNLKATEIDDGVAKFRIYDILQKSMVPLRLFPEIHKNYFEPHPMYTDCTPRTLWGLYNAVTRAANILESPDQKATISAEVGSYLGLTGRDN